MKKELLGGVQISQDDFDAQVQEWIAEEYEKLWAEPQAPARRTLGGLCLRIEPRAYPQRASLCRLRATTIPFDRK